MVEVTVNETTNVIEVTGEERIINVEVASFTALAQAVADAEAAALAAEADAILTAADVVLTSADVIATAADAVQTGLDATATAADVVQTGIDRTAAGVSAAAAAASAASIDPADYALNADNLSNLASAPTALVNLGLSATAAELNTLDGITATTAQLNQTSQITGLANGAPLIATAGTAAAFTLALPTSLTNAAGQSFNVRFHLAPSAGATIAIDGQTALALRLYDGAGALTALAAGDVAIDSVVTLTLVDDGGTLRAVVGRDRTLALAANVAGPGQTYQDLSGSRTIGTSYQNTETQPIMVSVNVTPGAGANATPALQVSTDNSTWITVDSGQDGTDFLHGFAIVMPGEYYRVNVGASIRVWAERR